MTNLLLSLSVLFIVLGLLIGQFSAFAYFIGLLVGGINNFFNVFSYVGASCSLISSVSGLFLSAIFGIGLLKAYHYLNN